MAVFQSPRYGPLMRYEERHLPGLVPVCSPPIYAVIPTLYASFLYRESASQASAGHQPRSWTVYGVKGAWAEELCIVDAVYGVICFKVGSQPAFDIFLPR